MSGHSTYQPQSRFMKWLHARLPIVSMLHGQFVAFPTPRNLNFLWTFGAILVFMLIIQIVTGVILVMHYSAKAEFAFDSIEQLMRDVNYGWLLRYLHSNGSSFFFFAAYVHMFRAIYYGSYKEPREVLWLIGVVILLLMVATGFMGYVLVWGQMSYWAATVITNLFSAFPVVGETIVVWLLGGYAVDEPTLTRFFSLHYLLPFVIVGLVVLHVWALHVTGQNNPTGIEPKFEKDTVPFTPYATLKDLFYFAVFLVIYAWFVLFTPNYLGHADNYIPADPSVTPAHIVPEWYYLPLYAILRAIPNKLLGVVAMFGALLMFAFLPWLDWSKTKSARYRPLYRRFFFIFLAVCIGLGWLGSKPPEGGYIIAARLLTAWYFLHFLVIVPLVAWIEKPEPVPDSISEEALKRKKMGTTIVMLAILFAVTGSATMARAEEDTPPPQDWSFSGAFGRFDRAQLQRGFKVYREVCESCHGLRLLSFRNLGEPGGPRFTSQQVAAIASAVMVKDINDKGETIDRRGRPLDRFPSPFANERAARAALGGFPAPDLSVIAKARTYTRGFPWFLFDAVTLYQEQGPDYIFALLTGYANPPSDVTLPPGTYFNRYFPGNVIGMPDVLSDGQVAYLDGSPETVAQYSKDVTAFLMWAAEPHLEARKLLGALAIPFLIVLATLFYITKRMVWRDIL